MAASVEPITARTGAAIRGVDIATPPSADDLATIRQAILDHHVVFLPEQSTDPDALVDFAKSWGDVVTEHPAYFAVHEQRPEIALVSNVDGFAAADTWHADMTYTDDPPLGTVLQLVTVPPFGGDTVWNNRAAAYDELSPPLQQFLDRRVLDVNPTFTTRIAGLRPVESERILSLLFEQAREPEFEVRWHWSPGDIAIWDNRCLWHYATADHGSVPRVGHRVALRGTSFA